LRTVKDVEYHTFHEAAEALGLIDGDNSWDDSFKEAAIWAMPPSIRRLFPMILVFGEPSNVHGFWDKHLEAMGEDYHCVRQTPQSFEITILESIIKHRIQTEF
jgi:hypothetical protein